MPLEKRDPQSGAKLFVPTKSERSVRASARQLKNDLDDVQALKKELQELIDSQKKDS